MAQTFCHKHAHEFLTREPVEHGLDEIGNGDGDSQAVEESFESKLEGLQRKHGEHESSDHEDRDHGPAIDDPAAARSVFMRRLCLIDSHSQFPVFLKLCSIFSLLNLDERLVRELDALAFALANGFSARDQLVVTLDAKLSADRAFCKLEIHDCLLKRVLRGR